MGRVVGSLSIVTAKDGDAESAMLASWLSQASFDPPGLTVAVKKDRAVESLLVRSHPLPATRAARVCPHSRATEHVRVCGLAGGVLNP